LKSEQQKEKEFKEMKSTIQSQQRGISDLKSFCDGNPKSPLCRIIDTKVTKGFIQKQTAGETKIVPLPPINKGIREAMGLDEISQRTKRAKSMMDSLNISAVDNLNVIYEDPESKKNMPIHIIRKASPRQLAEALSTCSLRGDCDKIYAEMRSRGINLQFKNKKGRWGDAAKEKEPEKEGPHI